MLKDEIFDYMPKTSFQRTPNSKLVALDTNHTHFILVDNSQVNKFGGEIKFRGELEKAIVTNKTVSGSIVDVPIVVLVLEGGPGTFDTVLSSVKNGSPCVFMEGSGRCADLFAYAISKLTIKEQNSEILKP
jgi:hypothetical protein